MPILAEAMALTITYRVPPKISFNFENKSHSRARFRALSCGSDSTVLSDSEAVNGAPLGKEKGQSGSVLEKENGRSQVEKMKKNKVKDFVRKDIQVLWDDGYGSKTVKDYLEAAKEIIKPDGGPARWFCPIASGEPLKDSPILLFLPGLDGTGMGLILHEKALGKAFEVRCLHVPVKDRTPFEGLVQFVEETVRQEHISSPNKPIYLVGDSFGGCLALAVAARNPTIDLVLVLANPATSFSRSQLQPLFPILEALPDELHPTVPYLLSSVMGDPLKMATVDIGTQLPLTFRFEQFSRNLTALLPLLFDLADIIPKDTLLWKLKLVKSAAAYANSRLHAVRAEVLVLASGKDNMLPSRDEAQRLKKSLQNCKVRSFWDNGHTLLLEDSLSLLTVIRGMSSYRRSRKTDSVSDFLPPSKTEFDQVFNQVLGPLQFASSSVMLSTLEDGKIVRGLQGVPDEGPVLMVGYHMLAGLEVYSLIQEFIREKKIAVRGVAHPELFRENDIFSSTEFTLVDWVKVFGSLPVGGRNLFKLLSTNSHVLLYPGGIHEAFHKKGEAYKLFWPDQPEFVRMAARFDATIVPFAAVGEDDLVELVLDSDDISNIPLVKDMLKEASRDVVRVRPDQEIIFPGLLPKVPGRLYYLFGKPIRTKGMKEMLQDKDNANHLYLQIKSEVEHNLSYLIKKREEDPYRNIVDRTIYRAIHAPLYDVPTFEP